MIIVPAHYPLWLQEDIATANRLLPQINIFVFFADDLPHTQELLNYDMNRNLSLANGQKPPSFLKIARERVQQLKTISANSGIPAKLRRRKLLGTALNMQGVVHSNALQTLKKEHPLPCFSLYHIDRRPSHAIIQLPPRGWTVRENFSYSFNLWQCHSKNIAPLNFHRAVFWHEVGHLDDYTYPEAKVTTPKDNERRADLFAYMHLSQGYHPQQADAFMAWRRVNNFLGSFMPRWANYWNFLDQPASIKATHTEIAAMAEVKLRALGETKLAPQSISLPRTTEMAAEWLLKLPDDSPFHAFNQMASRNRSAPHIMLGGLAHAVERNEFTYPASRQLAKDTLASARFLLPDVFNDSSIERHLRPIDSPSLIRKPSQKKWFPSLCLSGF